MTTDPAFIWRNGKIVPWAEATIHVNAVGHASVSAVFEGLAAYAGADGGLHLFRAEDHMRRLVESVRIVRLSCDFSVEQLVAAAVELLRANAARTDTYVRPWVFTAGIVRELINPRLRETETLIDTWPLRSALLTERGRRAGITSWTRIADNSVPPRVKAFANYHNARLANLEAAANGYDSPIFLNERGKVAEGPGACVVLVRRGRLVTPSITSGLLESITRDTVLRLAREDLGYEVEEREVDRTELYVAEELFFVGTTWEIAPILQIDGLQVGDGRMGPIVRALDRAYHDVVRGVDGGHPEWRLRVPGPAAEAVAAGGGRG
jgi:branched-chain amino acid aminotransferase